MLKSGSFTFSFPNPLLAGYADTVQETFDIVVIHLMTFGSMELLGLPIPSMNGGSVSNKSSSRSCLDTVVCVLKPPQSIL